MIGAVIMNRLFNKITMLFALCVFSSSVSSNSVLDQSSIPNPMAWSGAGGTGIVITDPVRIFAQTFTSGLNGQLSQIDIPVTQYFQAFYLPVDTLNVMILGTTPSGVPDFSQILSSVSLTPSQVPERPSVGVDLISLDLTAFNIPVVAGEVLSIALQTDAPFDMVFGSTSGYEWTMNPGLNPYTGGDMFVSYDSGANFGFFPLLPIEQGSDLAFRTYVNVSAVPELESYLMLIGGLSIFGLMMRRQRKLAAG